MNILLPLAIALGLIGICYEVCAPGSIWPGALGGLVATVAIYHAVQSGANLRQAATVWIAIPTGAILFFLISTSLRAGRNKQFVGDDSFRNEIGVALTAIHDAGTVRVWSEVWKARSAVAIPAGTGIVVRGKKGEVLDVTPR